MDVSASDKSKITNKTTTKTKIMNGSKRARDLNKASKYLSKIDIDFKGEDKALVKMLVTEAYIAGLNANVASEDRQPQEADICHNISVSRSCKNCKNYYNGSLNGYCKANNNKAIGSELNATNCDKGVWHFD